MNILRAVTQAIGTLRETGRYTPEQLVEIQGVFGKQFAQEYDGPSGTTLMGSRLGLLTGNPEDDK